MKKITLTLCGIALCFAAFAQNETKQWEWSDRPNSVSVTVGAPSVASMATALDDYLSLSGSRSQLYYGSYSLRYSYNVLRWLAVGAHASYDGWSCSGDRAFYDYDNNVTSSQNVSYTGHRASLLMDITFTYINRPHVQLYSGLGMGMQYYWRARPDEDNLAKVNKQQMMHVAASIVPIGLHVGNERVYGMAEVSIGTDALMAIGIGFHL